MSITGQGVSVAVRPSAFSKAGLKGISVESIKLVAGGNTFSAFE